MKKINKFAITLLVSIMLFSVNEIFAQGGAAINNTGAAADPSAILDVSSTSHGILIPRMTSTQRIAIGTPVEGLMIYQTDGVDKGFWYYDGTTWVQSIGPAGATGAVGATGADGATGPIGPTGLIADGNAAGNTPYWDGTSWVVNSSNIYNNGGSIGIGTTSPDASAKLEIASTTQGFLMPRMTETERTNITAATGLIVYQTDGTAGFYYYDGAQWTLLGAGGGSSTADPTLLYTIDGF